MEPQGIFPDGEYTLMESSRHGSPNSGANIDLWKLHLDADNPDWERLTWFDAGGVYKASNPVVGDDGQHIAFQVAGSQEVVDIGPGIYVIDLEERDKALNTSKEQQCNPQTQCTSDSPIKRRSSMLYLTTDLDEGSLVKNIPKPTISADAVV